MGMDLVSRPCKQRHIRVTILLGPLVAVVACGARTDPSSLLPYPPGAGDADGGNDAAWNAMDADADLDGSGSGDSSQAADTSSCDEGGPPPGGLFTCCNGQPCRGVCLPSRGCFCGGIHGGCWAQTICCRDDACVVPSLCSQ